MKARARQTDENMGRPQQSFEKISYALRSILGRKIYGQISILGRQISAPDRFLGKVLILGTISSEEKSLPLKEFSRLKKVAQIG